MLNGSLSNEKTIPTALRSMGLKRMKILYRSGALEHIKTMMKYVETGEMPGWISARYQELIRRRKNLNGDINLIGSPIP